MYQIYRKSERAGVSARKKAIVLALALFWYPEPAYPAYRQAVGQKLQPVNWPS
jgi:hypothetical protein